MSTVTSQAPSYRISPPRGDVFDNEPDKAWKDALKAQIEEGLSSMVADAKKNMQDELDKEVVTPHRRDELTREYNAAMKNIRDLAEDTFQVELERERQERRWASGKEMLPQWTEALKQEQQDIMDRIKGSQKELAPSSTVQPPEETPPPEPTVPTEVHSRGPIPVEIPPELAEKRERQRRDEEERTRDRKERERLEWERQERLNKEKRERQEKERQDKLEQERLEKLEEERREQERLEEKRREEGKENVRKERQERKLLKREAKEARERAAREKEDRKRQDLEKERQREELQRQEVEKERDRERHAMRGTTRRGSVNRSHLRREDYSGSPSVHRRSSHSTIAERHATELQESEGSSDVEEGPVHRVPERSLSIRRTSLHERPVEPPISRSIEHVSRPSLERHTARSPPNSIHQIWKPSSPEEDIRPPSASPLARRNSTTSIRSTGSAGHRPTIAEPILERSDSEADVLDDDDVPKAPEPETTWSSPMPRSKDKDTRREHRKSSASEHTRFDEAPPSFPGPPRTPHRPEEIHPLPPRTFSDRFDEPPSAYGGSPRLQYRPDDIGPRPSSSMRPPMVHKTSYSATDEWDHPQYPPNGPPRSVRSRTSFDERPYLYAQPPTPSGRVISRPPSIPNEEREYYDAPYRSYPTPPASVSRSSGREHPPQAWYPATRTDYQDGRSNTYKWAQQPESPSMRRSSLTGQPSNRESLYGNNYTEEPYAVHGPSEYSRPYDHPPSSASIPISRRRQDSAGMEEEGWKTWATEQTGLPPRRRDSERRGGGYSYQERDDGRDRDHDYGGRNGRDWVYDRDRDHELSRKPSWGARGDRPKYGPPPDPERREHWRPTHRSPTSSFSGNPPAHLFGGRDGHQSVSVAGDDDTDGYGFDGQETDVELDHKQEEWERRREERRRGTARELEREEKDREETWRMREESWKFAQAVKEDEERKRREAEVAKLAEERSAEEEARRIEREAEAEERARLEAARKAEQEKEEEERRIADEARRVADEKARKLAAAEARKLEEARKKAEEETKKLKEREAEIRRKAAEVRKKEEEAKRKEEEAQRKEEEAQKKEEEAQRKEEEAQKKEEEAQRKEEEAQLKEQEARKKEQEARRKEADARRKEEEARRKEWDAQQKEEEARRREEEAHSKEEETRRKEAEIKQREEELRKREEELTRREQEIASQKEAARLQREWDMEEEARRSAEEKKRADDERQERFRREQQEEFRRREQEIRQKAEERKRQDSVGADSAWTPPSSSYTSTRSFSQASAVPERNGQTSGWNSTTGSAWSTSQKPTPSANPSTSTSSTAKPRSGSINATYPPSTPSPHPPSAKEESEWRRRHEEQFQRQQERFREEQQRMENARQQRAQGIIPTNDEILGAYEKHERMWEKLPSVTELRWESIPWPTFRAPKIPEDITYNAVLAYLQSPLYPEKDKSRPYKDRLKEHIRRWHPDRFETKTLTRVIEEDQERVKEAAGSVVRTLNDLLTRSNAPSTPAPFA
ncbi:hypothetical protein DXG03_005457 [Asterophora parasitica]|uniref:Uncharacterized protein n=1 Tax=Asterophora parasitica TaxID=117018 RepID=A0A9P7G209_9AGAR|nr:hypothetical protein DXG03_005457 [Asterophora parasitica]